MKKLFLLFALLLTVNCFAGNPIAIKSLGIDSITGLNKEVQAWQLTIDTKSDVIVVVYDIVLLSPNGLVVSILETSSYKRINKDGDNKFNQLRESALGQAIEGMIAQTIAAYPNIQQ